MGFSAGIPGVLVSWVLLPNRVPAGSGTDHLAAPAEDHSLTYAGFASDMAPQRAEDLGDLFAPLLAKGAGSGSRR
jgi:hypothetical protein